MVLGKPGVCREVARAGQHRLKAQRAGVSFRRRPTHERREAGREWMREGLVAAELKEAELEKLPGSDARKVALARLIWQRTTVTQSWIAERLKMGQAANVSQQLRRGAREQTNLPKALRRFINRQTVNI